MTNSALKRDSAVMMSSAIPSAKYSCSGSELKLVKGRTAIEGLSGSVRAGLGGSIGVIGGCRACGPLRLPHWSDETEALARQCFDEALFLAGIADRAPGGIQAGRQRRIGHATPFPDGVDEVVLADDALPVADQIIEEVEYLWRDGDDVRPAMQFAPVGVECVLLEDIAQAANSLRWPPIVEAPASVATQRISRR